MAFTTREQKDLRDSLADQVGSPSQLTEKLTSAVASSDVLPTAAAVALIGTTEDLSGVDGTGQNATPLAATENRLDAIEAKVDELLTALGAS